MSRLLLSGVRHQLGIVFERYSGRRLADERQSLLKLSRKVSELQNAIGAAGVGYPEASGAAMELMMITSKKISQSEQQSLYNPEKLRFLSQEKFQLAQIEAFVAAQQRNR